jgi:iron complex transport system ATP-binding protein
VSVVLRLTGVRLRRGERTVLADVDWVVHDDQRWVVLGRNGSGKTSLVRVAALYQHPTAGTVEVLGETLGRTDVRRLRTRVGLASAGFADLLRPTISAFDVVRCGRHGALEPWWHTYDDADRDRAEQLLERFAVDHVAGQAFATLSSGERQRVQLARTLMNDPGLVLLDEPTAGLDLVGREELVGALGALADDPGAAPLVLVTHHLEEIPPAFTHVLLLAEGRVHAAGPLATTLTDDALSSCFGIPLAVTRRGERWAATLRR